VDLVGLEARREVEVEERPPRAWDVLVAKGRQDESMVGCRMTCVCFVDDIGSAALQP
jgi:hypothetical protein